MCAHRWHQSPTLMGMQSPECTRHDQSYPLCKVAVCGWGGWVSFDWLARNQEGPQSRHLVLLPSVFGRYAHLVPPCN